MNTIRVNDIEIGAAWIAEEMQYHPAASAEEAQRAAAEALVVRELLRQEARAQGFGDGYVIDPPFDGPRGQKRPLTKTAQIRMCGNSVCPQVAAAVVAANAGSESLAAAAE